MLQADNPALLTLLGDPERHSEGLLALTLEAISAGRAVKALRYAERLHRTKPYDPALTQLRAELLFQVGRFREGLDVLATMTVPQFRPERAMLRARLQLATGDIRDAAATLDTLVSLFAIEALPGFAELAQTVVAQSSGRFQGWTGRSDDGSRVGSGTTGPGVLGGAEMKWPPDWRLDGHVVYDVDAVRGAATLGWAPDRRMTIVVETHDGGVRRILTEPSLGDGGATIQVFSADLELSWLVKTLTTWVLLPDGARVALDPPPRRGPGSAAGRRRLNRPREPTPRISVIVPVYAGLEETLTCLRSVLETTSPDRAEVVVVYDAGPEPELLAALHELNDQGRITLLINAENRGYPASVNRGMALHPERDVVLLNADAEVFGDWLERLAVAAYVDRNIATVTPFANNASILSYPPGEDFVCDSASARALDALFAEIPAQPVIDLPTGVGHCLYIKRACLAEIGDFEDRVFGRGYGEENDFCLRAAASGWRNVAAANLFVRHIGGRSFGPLKQLLIENNLRVVNRLHPRYEAQVARFVADDPLASIRRQVDERRILADGRPSVLLITTGRDGGVDRHVKDRIKRLEDDGYRILQLKPDVEQGVEGRCRLLVAGEPALAISYYLPEALADLRDLLGRQAIDRAEIHHFLGLDPSAVDLPASLGIPFDVVVHDYGWICPRLTLVQTDIGYCGEPDVAECEHCVVLHGSLIDEDISVADLRTRSARLFSAAASVTVPSSDIAARLGRYFPNVTLRITPWEATLRGPPPSPPPSPGRARVAVIGAIGEHKGYRQLLDCARDAKHRKLPIDFVVIGYTEDDPSLFETGRVFVSGPFEEAEIAGLIEREACNVALFASIAPETWSYTLSHGLRSGLPIVAFDFGAVGERLRGEDRTWLMPTDCGPASLNDALLEATRPHISIGVRSRVDGEVAAMGDAWARLPTEGAWIEGLRVNPDHIQSMAVLAGGARTPWTIAPAWSTDPRGARPLFGFALRLHGPIGDAHACHYEGVFSSGAIDARQEGDVCRSPIANDPLVSLRVRLAARGLDGERGFDY